MEASETKGAGVRASEAVLLALALAVGCWLRIDGIGEMALFGDEFHTRRAAETSVGEILTSFDTVGSHVVLPLLQHVSLALFGDGVVSFRLVALVPGILTLLLFFPIARAFVGRTAALVGTLALAVHPMHVYYSRFGRSYALVVLLGVLLAFATLRGLEASAGGERKARRYWIAVGLLSALLPYTHLSSVGFVAAIGVVALVATWRARGGRALLAPAIAFGGGAVLAFLGFLPLLDDVSAYFAQTVEVKDQPLGWFGIVVLLAGGTAWAAVVACALVPLGALFLVREGRRVAVALLVAAFVGPLLLLCAQMPHGMEYAYARYLLTSLPFLALLAASGLTAKLPEVGATAAGVGLVLASFATGPLAPWIGAKPRAKTFENSYLALHPLTAFDTPWPNAPPIYAQLAQDADRDLVIVEATPLLTRSVLMYRNYALIHGARVRLGWETLPAAMRGGPFVELRELTPEDADYVVVHRDLPREVRRYWKYVYDELDVDVAGFEEGMMERHHATFIASQPQATPEVSADIASLLKARFGPAFYKDDDVLVWKL